MAASVENPDSPAAAIFAQLDANSDGQLQLTEIPDEQQALLTRLLRTSDEDQNGTLSLEEFTVGLEPTRKNKPIAKKAPPRLPGSDELLLLLAMMDQNADGRITSQEPPELLRPFYKILRDRIGANEKGTVILRQVARGAPRLTQAAKMYVTRQGIDVDLEYALLPEKNWKLVQDLDKPQQPGEFLADPEQAMELFKRIDANGDGKIVYEEVPEQIADRYNRLVARADSNGDEEISEQEFRQLSSRFRTFSKFRRKRVDK